MTPWTEEASGSELELSPEQMIESVNRAVELVVQRIQNLPSDPAWLGGSRAEFEAIMGGDPPEEGRPVVEVRSTLATIEEYRREMIAE
jgi:hypothetical protein